MEKIKQLEKEIEVLIKKIKEQTLLTSEGEQDIRLLIIKRVKVQSLKDVVKLIEAEITLQKAKLKDRKEYFEANKIYNWRIDGFSALLSKITGEFHSIGTGGLNTQVKSA